MDVIKDIPGYKVILKAVLKTQIQQLVEQLAEHTDEESVILTASVADGTLSHLGSESGKSYLDDHEDVKSSFLGFCLKRHHRKKQLEKEAEQEREREKLQAQLAQAQMAQAQMAQAQMAQAQMQASMGPGPRRGAHGPYFPGPRQSTPRHQPYPLSRPRGASGEFNTPTSQEQIIPGLSPFAQNVKQEAGEGQSTGENTSDNEQSNSSNSNMLNEGGGNTRDNSMGDMSGVSVKTEAGDSEDLEITGVELGMGSHSQEGWDPSVSMATGMNFDPSGATGSGGDMAGQQGYNELMERTAEGNYRCRLCGRLNKSRSDLVKHLRVHTGEKPFKCTTCGKSFRQKQHLQSHFYNTHRAIQE